MTLRKLIAPVATLTLGALSMVGVYAFADTSTTSAALPAQTQSATTVQATNTQGSADIETNDDAASGIASADKETNDGPDAQDQTQADGETND